MPMSTPAVVRYSQKPEPAACPAATAGMTRKPKKNSPTAE